MNEAAMKDSRAHQALRRRSFLQPLFWLAGIAAVALLLAYEHSLVSPRDLTRLNAAFFTMNGVIATVFLAFVAADLWLRS